MRFVGRALNVSFTNLRLHNVGTPPQGQPTGGAALAVNFFGQGAAAPRTLRELIEALGPRLGEWPEAGNSYLCFPLLGHLERLVHYGRVVSGRREGLATYSLTV